MVAILAYRVRPGRGNSVVLVVTYNSLVSHSQHDGAAGTRLGAYEITALIGAGGMGEVYRAHDTKLNRDVALKILPELFAIDAERLARFKREAQLLASLNHPNIAAIYGLEEAADVASGFPGPSGVEGSRTGLALVLELVEGPTLGDRIAQGPLPLDEALPIARQIAEALEAAHEQGIVHRDLKPANIKVRPEGTVKVLDFGLAKAFEGAPGPQDPAYVGLSQSPTITSPAATRLGTILGTAAYMSPEQAKGKAADKRADIWAFGCVLYEMLTGRRAFDGEEMTDVLARILERDVDFAALPASTPPAMRRLVRRCLDKDPRRRLRDIGDARIDIDALGRDPESESVSAQPVARTPRRQYWWAAAAVLAGGLLVGMAVGRSLQLARTSSTGDVPAPLLRTTIDLPPDAPLALGSDISDYGYNGPVVAMSPDGGWIAYVARTAAGRMLYVRDMSTGETHPLRGTEGAIHPFFSPDGQWVGFLTTQQVKKIPRQGGTVISLCEADNPVLAWWTQANLIYFTETETYMLSRVPADGGRPERVLSAPDVAVTRFNDVLPDGQTVLAEKSSGISGDFGDIIHVNIRTRETKLLVRSAYAARYAPPGYVLFARAGNVMAARYDADRGEVEGEPVVLASGVAMESLFGMLHAASSSTGVATYAPGGDLSVGKLAWVDRSGAVEYLAVPERVYGVIDLAPDGNRVAVHVPDVNDYIWIWDPARREGRRVTNQMPEGWPLWSPDGRRLAGTTPGSRPSVVLHDLEPSGAVGEGRMLEDNGRYAQAWSPQSDVLALARFPEFRIEFLGFDKPVNAAAFDGTFPAFSPDGRWLAYSSVQTGSYEVFIRSYPEGRVIGQVSTGGGIEPRWKPSGDLFYRNGGRWFSTHVATSPEPRWDPPRVVFDSEFIDTPGMSYDISRDGQRLLVVKRARPITSSKLNVIVNWNALEAR
jgi:serine/threonine protein kinase/Tol biopolymer transport system component